MGYVRVNSSVEKAGALAQRVFGVREYALKAEPLLGEAKEAFLRDVAEIRKRLDKAVETANALRERAASVAAKHRQRITRLQGEMESHVSVPSSSEDPSGHSRAVSHNEEVDRRNDRRRQEIAERTRSISDCDHIASDAQNTVSRMRAAVNAALQRANASFSKGERAVRSAISHCGNGWKSLGEAILAAKALLSQMSSIHSPANKMHPLCSQMDVFAQNTPFVGREMSAIGSLEAIGGARAEDIPSGIAVSKTVERGKITSIRRKEALAEIEQMGLPLCVCIPSGNYAVLGGKLFTTAMAELGYTRRKFDGDKLIDADGYMIWERSE